MGLLITIAVRPPANVRRLSRRSLSIGAVAIVLCAGIGAVALHASIDRRVELGSTSERLSEWHAAFDQWESSPLIGVGPDVFLRFHAADGTVAHFAHNEYLQIAADSRTVDVVLVLLAIGAVMVAVRREDRMTSCASGALVAFAAAGALDFDWHLSALGLVGGWVAGLGGRSTLGHGAVAASATAGAAST